MSEQHQQTPQHSSIASTSKSHEETAASAGEKKVETTSTSSSLQTSSQNETQTQQTKAHHQEFHIAETLGHGEHQIKRPQDSHIITPGDVRNESPEHLREMIQAQHLGEKLGAESADKGITKHESTSGVGEGEKHHHHHHPHPHGQGLGGSGGNLAAGLRKSSGAKDF